MLKRIITCALTVLIAAGTCGCSEDGTTSLVPLDASSSSGENSSAAGADSGTGEAESQAVTAAVTTAPPKETKKATTTPKKDPVPAEMDSIYASAAWFSKVSTVTSNEELKEQIQKLDAAIAKFGSKLGFAYQNLNTGVTITYNSSKQFQTCSTIKVPYCMALLKSGVDLDEQVTINRIYTDAAPEDGHLTGADYKKQYSVRKLIENSVMLSDNTAYVNLIDKYGRYVFNSGQYQNGINYLMYDGYYFSMASASELMKSYKMLYDYSQTDERGKWLVQLMLETSFNRQISGALGKKYAVAHKYGSDQETLSYHDCAICYADPPFLLIILTEQRPETEEADDYFRELSEIFDKLNQIIVS